MGAPSPRARKPMPKSYLAVCALAFFVAFRANCSGHSPAVPSRAADGQLAILSLIDGGSCFLYKVDLVTGSRRRLTHLSSGCEADPSLSHDGRLIAYSVAAARGERSSIWIAGVDGSTPHRLTPPDADAFDPVFALGDTKLYFAGSGYQGSYSPIARPGHHDVDIYSINVDGTQETRLTEQHLYEVNSVSISPDGQQILISTSRYPIGSLLEDYSVKDFHAVHTVYQPHVKLEPSGGAILYKAVYMPDSQQIAFLAASDPGSGTFNYNLYEMSAITGSDSRQLTSLTGVIDNLTVVGADRIALVQGSQVFLCDSRTSSVTKIGSN